MRIQTTLAAIVLVIGGTAHANNLLDSLKSQAGNYAMPSLGENTIGSVAGVLQYCVKNNYLSADAASGLKDRLLEKITGQKKQQASFSDGLKGVLRGDGGQSLNLQGLSSKLKTRACDYVLKNAGSLV